MYNLSIFFGPSPVPAQFLFKNKEKAEDAFRLADASISDKICFTMTDDFGQTASIRYKEVHAAILEDMDLGEESRIQRGLSQARGQAKANERARTDPALRSAMGAAQGPSVLTPFSNGRFNG